jgi:cytochrome c oxidase assembly protein subunit 15
MAAPVTVDVEVQGGHRPGQGRYHTHTVSSLRIGPRSFLFLCRFTLATIVLNVVTGAAVRLSDSGLGCPDWPTCSHSHLTPPLSLHPVVEFGNRVVVTVLVVACAVTTVAAFLRRPARRDLRWLSIGLVLGVVGEAVLGAFVVYSKLNAYVVMTHFMVGMALLGVAVILTLRADHAAGRGTVVVAPAALWLTRVLLGLIVVVLAAGTATTGAGPHAGGKGAKRVPIGLEDMSRIHAEIVLSAGLLLLVLLWVLWKTNAPAHVQDSGRILLAVMVVQGIIGYTQFFTHLPAVLVGIHVLGASTVWATALWFHHGLSDHRAEETGDSPPDDGPGLEGVSLAGGGYAGHTGGGSGADAVAEPV